MSSDSFAGAVGNPQSLNRYAYVINNPESLIDPLGMVVEEPNGCVTDGAGTVYCAPPGGLCNVDITYSTVWLGAEALYSCIDDWYITGCNTGPFIASGQAVAGGQSLGGGRSNSGWGPLGNIQTQQFGKEKDCTGYARVLGPGKTTNGRRGGAFNQVVAPGTAAVDPQQFYPGYSMPAAKAEMTSSMRKSITGFVVDPATGKVEAFSGVSDVIGGAPINGETPHKYLEGRFPGDMLLELEGVPQTGADVQAVHLSEDPSLPCPAGTTEVH